MSDNQSVLPLDRIEQCIYLIRGQKVMLDADLARLYGVETRALVQAVKRNLSRFPDDFLFQLTAEEAERLRSQNVISKPAGRGGRRYLPYAFTEHGAIMAANVLNSPGAMQMSVFVVRAFVKLRETLLATKELTARLDAVERKLDNHDETIRALVVAIRQLMTPPEKKRRPIGFRPRE